ncbi:zinc finger CCCH domain-containing protein 14-like isoform X2 [Polyodon spathula]|uniref:zinc finger CCCH domain-containing protein 14-like isoform X2 n=1 Tax=Polyodon spathula TaxID=7913 RepID=UPI001B7ED748|nr:zinc finger CCCH domain-containing protein 14-like isoform X2 [Polyodon spathula]
MEIGTEISKKIRAAIKGKLQELGAYVDEELPDYIMVMVANKKNAQQMADDLSLFLGNNTVKFTVWLHGVLEKLRSVAVEPLNEKPQPMYTDSSTLSLSRKSRLTASGHNERRGDEARALTVSSSRSERHDSRVSTSSSQEHVISSGGSSSERNVPRLMSTVKPLMELSSAEAVIDIKPEPDDDLIDEDLNIVADAASSSAARKKPLVTVTYSSARPSAELYKAPGSSQHSLMTSDNSSHSSSQTAESRGFGHKPVEILRSTESASGTFNRLAENYVSRSTKPNVDRISREEEVSRKRKVPVISSVVKVGKSGTEGQDSEEVREEEEVEDEDEDEEEESYVSRTGSLSSSVSVPSKPERRPSLPPSKQANRNLILKAISEAQKSVSKTTSYPPVSQRQMVPVAPRTRMTSEITNAVTQHVQENLHHPDPRLQVETSEETGLQRLPVQSRSLVSRLQLDAPEETLSSLQEVGEMGDRKPDDTRSFILKRAVLDEVRTLQSRLGAQHMERVPALPARLVQTRDAHESRRSSSPKFIVTLDGVPSPPGFTPDQEEAEAVLKEKMKTAKTSVPHNQLEKKHKLMSQQGLARELPVDYSDDEVEVDHGPVKRQKVLERCKFWPVCKSGDDCPYHHPKTLCKTFPNCKFGEKCLFIHPNCKYDAKCTKPDCPFTHTGRRGPAPPVKAPAPSVSGNVCHFFPECKSMDCRFYHPKPCRFTTQCKRLDCSFYHPTVSLPPRHALKWTRAQNS